MNTKHTTRTAVHASALTVTLTGLLFGAPAIAFADPSTTTPAPPPPPASSRINQPCLACTAVNPALTGSNSGASDASGNHPIPLLVSGKNFTPNGSVHMEVWVNGEAAAVCTADAPADPAGVIDSDRTNCSTGDVAANGYALATDVATGQQTNRLPVKVMLPPWLRPELVPGS
jgi:hypothetical protein